jgi:uncharacterized protein YbjT (DUF2867 family)
MIAITGAAGKTGRAVLEALVAKGARVRALVHRPERVEVLRDLGATEVVAGDLTDAGLLERALAGSSTIYHICPNMRPDEEEIGSRVIDICRRIGVDRFVYHSVLHPQIEAMPHHWKKLRVEESLLESGLSFTVLQPVAYMQNILAQLDSIAQRGLYEVPYAASTRLALVDLVDVAEAAARVLVGERHEGAIYELCGPEALDQTEIAAILTSRLGRHVELGVVSRDEWSRRARDAGISSYAVESLTAMFAHYERHGFWGNSRVLELLLERPPETFAAVVDRWLETSDRGIVRS